MKTIRSRLIIILFVCFSFIVGLTGVDYYNIFALEKKISLIEQFDDFKDDILELRRYEKNYFLTGDAGNVDQMNYYLQKTESAFLKLGKKIPSIINYSGYQNFSFALNEYRFILEDCERNCGEGLSDMYKIRPAGKILTSFSKELIAVKRSRIKKVLEQMLFVPFTFSAGFIFLVIVVMHMTREDILKPLTKLQVAAVNASKGIFNPIEDVSQSKTEIAGCIGAFNKMVAEIDTGQQQLLQSRKMASIGTFTSGIAHELNNPINNISLIVDSLTEDEDILSAEERIKLYNDLMEQAERATEIVKNLLEFSRTDQDYSENISMKEMVEKTQRLLKNELTIKQIKFHTRVQENLPIARIDKSRLQQALINLLLNGIHAMPDGGDLSLNITSDPDSEEIRVDISDTGIGIPKEHLASIFDPFFTTKKEGEGTGLGLSVTYNIIQRHNGRISVDSTPGQGTCFSIFLPAKV